VSRKSIPFLPGWVAAGCLLLMAPLLAGTGKGKAEPVPTDVALLRSLKSSWEGVSCTGDLSFRMGQTGEPLLTAPVAVAYRKEALNWVAFITPPAPCSGTVVLGKVRVGLGNRPAMEIGTPPGMVMGNKPALLTWRKVQQKTGEVQQLSANSLCGAQASDGDGTSGMFGGFAGALGHQPDTKTWDAEHPGWLKLEGRLKGQEKSQQGRYTVWLDKNKGYSPVLSQRVPEQGAPVTTRFEPKEVSPGHWLPAKWEISGAGRPTLVGQFEQLRCDRPLPDGWFESTTYPDVTAQTPVIKSIRQK
jgi:hypothetical protein